MTQGALHIMHNAPGLTRGRWCVTLLGQAPDARGMP